MPVRVDIETAFSNGGIERTHFFNGRLLSAEDLTREQDAGRDLLALLGHAVGEGVAWGLEVKAVALGAASRKDPAVRIERGVALNRLGQGLYLPAPVEVSLRQKREEERKASEALAAKRRREGKFGTCSLAGAVLAGAGVYLVAMAPDDAQDGRARVSGLGDSGVPCAFDRLVGAVRFRAIRLPVDDLDERGPRFRNQVAHRCFGSYDDRLARVLRDPFGSGVPDRYGLLDDLRDAGLLGDRDVPLALVDWRQDGDDAGLRWVDVWSVRRRPARVGHGSALAPVLSDRRRAEGEAMVMQFQEEIAAIPVAQRSTLKAVARFERLPPAGVLPLGGVKGFTGFTFETFFAELKVRPAVFVEAAQVPALLADAVSFPPIETAELRPEWSEVVWRYFVRENSQVPNSQVPKSDTVRQPYAVFAAGNVPFRGNARFDLAKWGYASFALV